MAMAEQKRIWRPIDVDNLLVSQPDSGEQPVGGIFLKESCLKTVQGRSITVERKLFRRPDQDMKTFVDETRILILRSEG